MATKRVMATATRVVGDEEGNGDGSKSDGDGNENGGQAIAMRVMARRVVGKQCQQDWRQQQW
jgi:hypothetical protein